MSDWSKASIAAGTFPRHVSSTGPVYDEATQRRLRSLGLRLYAEVPGHARDECHCPGCGPRQVLAEALLGWLP